METVAITNGNFQATKIAIHLFMHGKEVPETLIDAVVTSLIAMHDLKSEGPLRNSRRASRHASPNEIIPSLRPGCRK